MKKRVAILTQPLIANYGGILQNFALQKVLEKNGFKPETVNRLGNKTGFLRNILSWIKNETYNRLKGTYYTKFSKEQLNYFRKNAIQFINKNIIVSHDVHSTIELKKYIENKFEAVVVGSDQTWRPKMSVNIFNYFLDFLENNNSIKKLAYATSFGTDDWEFSENQTLICSKLAKQFNAISVRESSGVELCKKYLNVDSKFVLDPTLLLDVEDYLKVIPKENLGNQNGLFSYVLDKNNDKKEFIESVSKKINLNHFTNQPKKDFFLEKSDNIDDFVYPPIESWLSSFYNADFIITDSFHGTVFSILFNKPFISIANNERGAARFKSLLQVFDLEDRLIFDVNSFDWKLLSNNINYSVVNKRREELKQESNRFLIENLC